MYTRLYTHWAGLADVLDSGSEGMLLCQRHAHILHAYTAQVRMLGRDLEENRVLGWGYRLVQE